MFQEKSFLCYILLTDQISLLDCLITFWDIDQCVYSNCLLTNFDVTHFEIKLIFLIKPFFYMTKKSKQKFKYLDNEKNF